MKRWESRWIPMRKAIVEDWSFAVEVLEAGPCRVGLEPGDRFVCRYDCPGGFCPKTMGLLHTLCEVARAGGDYRLLGGRAKEEIDFVCADGVVRFRLTAFQEKNED